MLAVPKGWIALRDAYGEISNRLAPGPASPPYVGHGDGPELVSQATWEVLSKIRRFALMRDGSAEVLETEDDGPPFFLRPKVISIPGAPLPRFRLPGEPLRTQGEPMQRFPLLPESCCEVCLVNPGSIVDATDRSYNDCVSLGRGKFEESVVLLDMQQYIDVMERLGLRLKTHQVARRRVAQESDAVKRALEHIKENGTGGLSSERLKNTVAPGLGPRPWKRIWDQVAEIYPELSRPGRRPKS